MPRGLGIPASPGVSQNIFIHVARGLVAWIPEEHLLHVGNVFLFEPVVVPDSVVQPSVPLSCRLGLRYSTSSSRLVEPCRNFENLLESTSRGQIRPRLEKCYTADPTRAPGSLFWMYLHAGPTFPPLTNSCIRGEFRRSGGFNTSRRQIRVRLEKSCMAHPTGALGTVSGKVVNSCNSATVQHKPRGPPPLGTVLRGTAWDRLGPCAPGVWQGKLPG